MDDSAIKYLEKKEDIAISTDFMRSLISKYDGSRGWFGKYRGDLDVITSLFSILLKKHEDMETLDQINHFLSSFSHFFFDDDYPKSLLDLVLEAKHYNSILELIKSGIYRKDAMPYAFKSFIKAIKRKAEQEKDETLFACHFFLDNTAKYENIIKKLNITEWNYKLFVESKQHYLRAVNYLIEKNKIKDAARICRRYNNYSLSAQIYEDSGDYGLAAKDYREGKVYQDAIRCYQKVGDEQGTARVYERMKEFDKAVNLWKKLGKTNVPRGTMVAHKIAGKEGDFVDKTRGLFPSIELINEVPYIDRIEGQVDRIQRAVNKQTKQMTNYILRKTMQRLNKRFR